MMKQQSTAAADPQRAFPVITNAEPEPTYLAELRKRLGHRSFVSVSMVATACDVSVATVLSWIEAGVVEATNVSVADRPYYRIYAPSVLNFFKERLQA